MESEWQEVGFGDIFEVKHGFAFKGEHFCDEPTDAMVVTPGNFAIGGGFQYGKPKYYDGPIPEDYVLKPGQVIVTMTDLSKASDTLGVAATVPDDQHTWLHNQRIGLLKFKKSFSSDPAFFDYLLRSHEYRWWVIGSATGTTVKHTSPSRIQSFRKKVPSKKEQTAIAHILGTLDDKIELNRRMNVTLESMARALFKSWFVDFDPVIDNALAAGNPIPEPLAARAQTRRDLGTKRNPLPKNIQKLFPDAFACTDEAGWIPKGWEVTEFSKLCSKVQNGGTPRRSNEDYWENGTIPWLTSGEVRQSLITTVDNNITEAGLENSSAKWLPADATVVAMYGATAGQVAYVSCPLTTNQAVCGLVPNESFGMFNYLFLSGNENTLAHQARGSAQQNINKGIIERTQVVKPLLSIAEAFEEMVVPYFQKRIQCMHQNDPLAKLRDTLLPKLLSGELRIPDAEKLVTGSL